MRPKSRQIEVTVQAGDVLQFKTDVLVLKYAQALYGVDAIVARRCLNTETRRKKLPDVGETTLVASDGNVSPEMILFVGVKPLTYFSYREIREFSRRALAELSQRLPKTSTIAMTLHGAEYGLDELEAFEAEVAGIVDAVTGNMFPVNLERVEIVEIDHDRARRLGEALQSLLPNGSIEKKFGDFLERVDESVSERFRSAGYASDAKAKVFVAMPFRDDMDDIYHYGIQAPVRDAGYLCQRADLARFAGDVMEWVKRNIRDADLVVADLTGSNANVFLEVGYAWGCGVPTVLLVQDAEDLNFDVQGQRCLVYKKIKELEETLREELVHLRGQSGI